MAYTIQAFIGDLPDLRQNVLSGMTIISLAQGKALIPLTDDIRDVYGIPFLPFDEGEPELPVPQSIKAIVGHFPGPISYVEAVFFGGDGTQASAIWKEQNLIFGPVVSVCAINEALQRLGVVKGDCRDEFEALRLGTHRNTNDWVGSSSKSL